MNKALSVAKTVLSVLLLAALGGMLWYVSELPDDKGGLLISAVNILAAMFALFYLIVGCGKAKGAEHFRQYLCCLCAWSLLSAVLAGESGAERFFSAFCVLVFGCAFALATGKDIGRKRSLGYAVAGVSASVLSFVSALFFCGGGAGVIPYAAGLIMGLTMPLVVLFKYEDKAARGSK